MDINWNLYKSFVVAYETRNLTKASSVLKITREAVGRNIKELGNQLGLPLFIPHPKGVEPTKEADNIYPTIKNVVDSLNGLEASVKSKRQDVIKMAVSSSSAEMFVKLYLAEFCTKYPKIRLELHKLEGLSAIEQRKLDFIIDWKDFIKPDFKIIELTDMTGCFIASKTFLEKHGLGQNVSRDNLFKLPIISRSFAWSEFIKQSGVTEKPFVTETSSTDLTYTMVKNSIGVGYFVRELFEKMQDKDLVLLNVDGIQFVSTKIACGYCINLSEPAKIFLEGLRKFAQ